MKNCSTPLILRLLFASGLARFGATADHSDGMGFFPDLIAGKPHILAEPLAKDWYERLHAGDGLITNSPPTRLLRLQVSAERTPDRP